jgi:hypothetical protein
MRINAVDITSQLVEEHGLHEAYQVALNGAAKAVKLDDNYSLSVMREVKATLRSKIVKQINAAKCAAS